MILQEAISLIRCKSISDTKAASWADLGCGKGLFTEALSSFLHAGSVIFAVDSNARSLSNVRSAKDGVVVKQVPGDFVKDALGLQGLDGILMANSLHFVKDKENFLQRACQWLGTEGVFVILEYDMDRSNPWVPYPISFSRLQQLFMSAGFGSVERLHDRPSIYQRARIYSALCLKTTAMTP